MNINDLPDKTRSKIRLFADYTAIYLAVSNLQDAQIHVLQQDLDHLHEWELRWDMDFNPSISVLSYTSHEQEPQSLVNTCFKAYP